MWHKDHGCHALFSEGKGTFKHVTKNPTKNQNFSKILFASFHMMQEASERYRNHFSICNIKGAEKFSWSFPVHLFPGVPASYKNQDHCDRMLTFSLTFGLMTVGVRVTSRHDKYQKPWHAQKAPIRAF